MPLLRGQTKITIKKLPSGGLQLYLTLSFFCFTWQTVRCGVGRLKLQGLCGVIVPKYTHLVPRTLREMGVTEFSRKKKRQRKKQKETERKKRKKEKGRKKKRKEKERTKDRNKQRHNERSSVASRCFMSADYGLPCLWNQ